jgi:tRNA-2-methylthio-N6-dimethylallyladenosine synthase
VDGIERVRFTSPHPRDFTEDVLEAMVEVPTVMPHLHLPLQSGSDRVLKAMRRSYRSRRYLDLVERTRELMPDAALTTDIIVGFPGETDDDFDQTLDVVAACRFDQAFTFQYSPRPGTPAAEMVDDFIDPEVVRERYHRLEELTRRHSHEAHERLVGHHHDLLVESASKTDPTRWSGRTPGNHLVHLPAAATPDAYAPGDIVTVQVVEAAANYAIAEAPTVVRHTAAGRATAAAMQAGLDIDGASRPGGITAPVGLPTVSATRASLPVVSAT